jgi:hypothetical protein
MMMKKYLVPLSFLLLMAGALLSPLVLMPSRAQDSSPYARRLALSASNPASATEGQIYGNTASHVPKYYNGSSWLTLQTTAVTPGGSNGQIQINNSGSFGGVTLGGDCTFASPNVTCAKTNGSSFAPSATTDTTNASNISSGTLASARGGTGSAFFGILGPTVLRNFSFPDANATIARTDAAQTLNGTQTHAGNILADADNTRTIGGSSANRFQIFPYCLSVGNTSCAAGEANFGAGTSKVRIVSGYIQSGSAVETAWSSGDPGSVALDTGTTRNAAGVVEVNNGTPGTYRDLLARGLRGNAVTFTNAISSPVEGTIQAFTDSTTNTWGATITGGGANHVLGYYDGTNWTVLAK